MKEGKLVKFNLQQLQNGHVAPFKLSKLLDPEASWDKDQLGDVLHWIRQVVALVCGLLWGAIPFVGAIWIVLLFHCTAMALADAMHLCHISFGYSFLSLEIIGQGFLVLSSGIIYGYYAIILKIDEEDFGGHGTLLQEGLFASLTLFLLAWILVYSLAHF
ncbi:hypothetical protein HHK36_011022 [Tetracentron sinense]|uniref:Rab5-interacting protein n=1 Tax=Tetracentron sinense TaxID=13715 RepID=A0A834Z8E7_TETSI|nr:hypothetical protein HHK36_011022 [Tetracentron sinense]